MSSLIDRTNPIGTGFGIEFVCIAYYLFLHGLGLIAGESCPCMAFSNSCVTRKTLGTENVTTYRTMFNVRLRTCTMDGRSITPEDAYIMEHGRLFKKLDVDMEFRMPLSYQQATICDLTAMV